MAKEYDEWIRQALKWLRENPPLIESDNSDKQETLPMSSTNKKG